MKHADLLARLLPPVSYSPTDPTLATELNAEGNALDAVQANGARLLAGITPDGAGEMITDWERVLGITPEVGATQQERIDAVVEKIAEVGGLSIPYFKALAARLGYKIDIVEPQPFRVDQGRIGDTIYIDDIIFVWQVAIEGTPNIAYYFRVGQSAIGERLLSFSDPVLEQVFTDLKPAHTFVYFSYQG